MTVAERAPPVHGTRQLRTFDLEATQPCDCSCRGQGRPSGVFASVFLSDLVRDLVLFLAFLGFADGDVFPCRGRFRHSDVLRFLRCGVGLFRHALRLGRDGGLRRQQLASVWSGRRNGSASHDMAVRPAADSALRGGLRSSRLLSVSAPRGVVSI